MHEKTRLRDNFNSWIIIFFPCGESNLHVGVNILLNVLLNSLSFKGCLVIHSLWTIFLISKVKFKRERKSETKKHIWSKHLLYTQAIAQQKGDRFYRCLSYQRNKNDPTGEVKKSDSIVQAPQKPGVFFLEKWDFPAIISSCVSFSCRRLSC